MRACAPWLVGSSGGLLEVHLLCTPQFAVTVWTGDPHLLDDVRGRFSRRAVGLDGRHYQAAGILLQLLLSTLDEAITELDSRSDEQQLLATTAPVGSDEPSLGGGRLKLELIWAMFVQITPALPPFGGTALPGSSSASPAWPTAPVVGSTCTLVNPPSLLTRSS